MAGNGGVEQEAGQAAMVMAWVSARGVVVTCQCQTDRMRVLDGGIGALMLTYGGDPSTFDQPLMMMPGFVCCV